MTSPVSELNIQIDESMLPQTIILPLLCQSINDMSYEGPSRMMHFLKLSWDFQMLIVPSILPKARHFESYDALIDVIESVCLNMIENGFKGSSSSSS